MDDGRQGFLERARPAHQHAEDAHGEARHDGPHQGTAWPPWRATDQTIRTGEGSMMPFRIASYTWSGDVHAEGLHLPDRLVERRLAPNLGGLEPQGRNRREHDDDDRHRQPGRVGRDRFEGLTRRHNHANEPGDEVFREPGWP